MFTMIFQELTKIQNMSFDIVNLDMNIWYVFSSVYS